MDSYYLVDFVVLLHTIPSILTKNIRLIILTQRWNDPHWSLLQKRPDAFSERMLHSIWNNEFQTSAQNRSVWFPGCTRQLPGFLNWQGNAHRKPHGILPTSVAHFVTNLSSLLRAHVDKILWKHKVIYFFSRFY